LALVNATCDVLIGLFIPCLTDGRACTNATSDTGIGPFRRIEVALSKLPAAVDVESDGCEVEVDTRIVFFVASPEPGMEGLNRIP